MKKSELITEMNNYYNEIGYYHDTLNTLQKMEMLLRFLEIKGMLPPVNKHCDIAVKEAIYLSNTFEWEPENE